jgi:hypothetical protein
MKKLSLALIVTAGMSLLMANASFAQTPHKHHHKHHHRHHHVKH